jgi:hypothetical protein
MTTKTYTVAIYRGHREGPNLVLIPDPDLIEESRWVPRSWSDEWAAFESTSLSQLALNLTLNKGRPLAFNTTPENYRLFAVVSEGAPERMVKRIWPDEEA